MTTHKFYALDDPKKARDIVLCWQHGTASAVETALLNAISGGDASIRARLRQVFPVLVEAYEQWFRGEA